MDVPFFHSPVSERWPSKSKFVLPERSPWNGDETRTVEARRIGQNSGRQKDGFNLEERQRTERLARVIATAEYVWNDSEAAKRFLSTPHVELGHRTPLETASTELGAQQVEEILSRLLHGLPV